MLNLNMNSSNLKILALLFIKIVIFCSCQNEIKKNVENSSKINKLLLESNDLLSDNKLRKESANQLLGILKTKRNDSLTRILYFKLADRYFNLYEDLKFKDVSEIVFKLSKKSKDSVSIAKSLKYLGDYHYNIFQNDSAYFYLTKSEKTYQKIKYKIDLTEIQLYKANILLFEKDFAGCEIAIINILKKALKEKNNRLIYDCYITLGNALDGLNDFDKSLEYFNKALKVSDKLINDSQFLSLKSQTYNYIGTAYNKNQSYKKAISYFEKGLKISNSKKIEPFLYANLINNLGYSKFKLADISAINQLNEAYKIRDSLKNIPGIVSSKINLSEYYLYQKDTAKALVFGNDAKIMAHENKIFEDELKTLELLAKIDPKNNEIYNSRFIKLTDSLQNNERATRNKFARIEFETDEILNEKNSIEIEKDKISSQRWLILGSCLLVLIFAGLLYFTKMQHSRNKVLEFEKEQQIANEAIYQLMLDQQSKIDEGRNAEKKRISQELHDGIIGKLASIRLNLFVLSKRNDQETIDNCLVHINKIIGIENEIQAISRDLAKDIFLEKDSFKIIIQELFQNQALISNLKYTIDIDNKINWENIASTTKMHLYRIFQESLQNINKYANAKNVNLKIYQSDGQVFVSVSDNGKGFDVLNIKNGIGLKNMKSRSDLISGMLKIDSKKDKGTCLSLVFPI